MVLIDNIPLVTFLYFIAWPLLEQLSTIELVRNSQEIGQSLSVVSPYNII